MPIFDIFKKSNKPSIEAWPFSDPQNVVTVTTKKIIHDGMPILLVCHDAEDGGWQFLTGQAFHMADGMLVGLKEIVKRDPSIFELADLPLGWKATRTQLGEPWQRFRSEDA